MMEKLVSVIIPAYNIERYISRCLDSIMAQTYNNLEIIVIDDGSKDQTAEILDDYQKRDSRIIVVHKENGGVSSARNNGLDIATGDYISFVDGDDLIESNMYEILVKILEKEKTDIAHCGYQMIFPDRVDYYYNTGTYKIQTREVGVKDLLFGKMIEPTLNNKLYRRELFNSIRLDEKIQINEDLEANYRLFKKSKKSVYYDVPLYHYMIRKSSATKTNSIRRKFEDPLLVLFKIKQDCKNNKEIYKVAYERYIYLLMAICRMNTEEKEYQKNKRNLLKKEMKTKEFKKIIPQKLRYMSYLSSYCPGIMKIIYKIYDLKTGASKKYAINEE